eukprot:365560-Chlamydomonas_euryale.AAC.3
MQTAGAPRPRVHMQGHDCGRFKEDTDRRVGDAARSHKRYMHYFERWKGHSDSHAKENITRWGLFLLFGRISSLSR